MNKSLDSFFKAIDERQATSKLESENIAKRKAIRQEREAAFSAIKVLCFQNKESEISAAFRSLWANFVQWGWDVYFPAVLENRRKAVQGPSGQIISGPDLCFAECLEIARDPESKNKSIIEIFCNAKQHGISFSEGADGIKELMEICDESGGVLPEGLPKPNYSIDVNLSSASQSTDINYQNLQTYITLTDNEKKVLDYIFTDGPKSAKEICNACGILEESTVTGRIIPALKEHDFPIKNRRTVGYYYKKMCSFNVVFA